MENEFKRFGSTVIDWPLVMAVRCSEDPEGSYVVLRCGNGGSLIVHVPKDDAESMLKFLDGK